ncbi:hypothetical protein GB937_008164 [Aspergillus fischeri]|nr:hypothetical protein GB937_008164 [Aspergillus fischeri]
MATKLLACSIGFLHLHTHVTEAFATQRCYAFSEMTRDTGVVDSEGNQRLVHAEIGPAMLTSHPAGS